MNILSLNALPCDMNPMSTAAALTTIQEAISKEPSFCNIDDLMKAESNKVEPNVEHSHSWFIYDEDGEHSKSTDALLKNNERQFPESLSYSIIKENQMKSIPSGMATISRSRSASKNSTSHAYEQPAASIESLTDSQGYVDDFDESCALIAQESSNLNNNDISQGILPTNDFKRNSLTRRNAPYIHRFSAGDADKIERGIKTLPSTRSLKDS